MKRLSFLIFLLLALIVIPRLPAQENFETQPIDLVVMPTGEKVLVWYGKAGRSYFVQASKASAPLEKWTWAPIIESGNDAEISHEVGGTGAIGFFRLKYTDQVPGSNETLDTADFDQDGLSNLDEIALPPPLLASDATDPLDPDTDHDGMNDGFERTHGLDPNDDGTTDPDNGPAGDPDGDGLTNAAELAHETDPNDPDSDDDGLTDGEEIILTSDPNDPNTDDDSLVDGEDADPKEILVDWKKTPESSYLLIEVDAPLAESDPNDLNDKGEVLFKNGIWAAGTWIPLETPENVVGSFPIGGDEEQDYVIRFDPNALPDGYQHFDDSHNLAGLSSIELSGPAEPEFSSVFAHLNGQSAQDLAIGELLPAYRSSSYGLRLFGMKSDLTVVAALRYSLDDSPSPSDVHSKLILFPPNGASPVVRSLPGDAKFRNSYYTDTFVTPSGWIACHTLAGTTGLGGGSALWNPQGTSMTLPTAANVSFDMIHLAELPKGSDPASGANVGLVTANSNGESLVLIPDQEGDMQNVESMSGKQIKLLAPDGTGMTSDNKLWRNGKLIPLRDLCPKIGELLDQGYQLFPLKANKGGTYLIQAENTQGNTKTFVLPPVDIVPDANMAGVVGDIVESVNSSSKIKHFVSPKKDPELTLPQDYVVLRATGITAEQITPGHANQIAEWEGGEEVPGEPLKRRVPRQATGTTPTKVKIKQGGAVSAEMYVWVVWSDVTITKGMAAFSNFLGGAIYGVSQQPTEGWRFVFKIQPASILDQATLERPKLSGLKRKDPPGSSKTYTIPPPLDPGDSAKNQWDVSRQYQVTIRNPGSIPQADLQQGHVADAWIVNQPAAADTPVLFPSLDVEGNDDPPTTDEDANPYQAMTNNPRLNHQKGELSSDDAPILRVLDGWGAVGRSYSVEMNFKEFARVEIWDGKRQSGRFWFRISDHIKWHHYLDATYDNTASQWKKSSPSSDLGHPKP